MRFTSKTRLLKKSVKRSVNDKNGLIVRQKPSIISNLERAGPLNLLMFMSQTTKRTPGLTIFMQTTLLLSSGTENTKNLALKHQF